MISPKHKAEVDVNPVPVNQKEVSMERMWRTKEEIECRETGWKLLMLLCGCATIFDINKIAKIKAVELIDALCTLDIPLFNTFNNGKPITSSQLANGLNVFRIKSKYIKFKSGIAKGYRREWFEEAYEPYAIAGGKIMRAEQDGKKCEVIRGKLVITDNDLEV